MFTCLRYVCGIWEPGFRECDHFDECVLDESFCAWSGQTSRMFSSDEFWKGAMFGAVICGIITVVLLKLWHKKAGKKARKWPTENDERFWQLQQVRVSLKWTWKNSKRRLLTVKCWIDSICWTWISCVWALRVPRIWLQSSRHRKMLLSPLFFILS